MAFIYSLKIIIMIKIRVYVSAAQILVGDFIGTVYCVGILQDVLSHSYAAVIMEVFSFTDMSSVTLVVALNLTQFLPHPAG